MVERNKLNFIIDAVMFVAIASIGFIGLMLGFVIPTGEVPAPEKYLWGLHRHDWGNIHLYLSLSLITLLVVHIILHWSWIKATAKKYLGKASMLWTLVLASCVLLFLLWFFYPKGIPRAGHTRDTGGGTVETTGDTPRRGRFGR